MYVTGDMKSYPRTILGTKFTWQKRPSAFFPRASLMVPQGMVHYTSFFQPCSNHTEVCLPCGSRFLSSWQSIWTTTISPPINLTPKHITLNHNIPPLTPKVSFIFHNTKCTWTLSKSPHSLWLSQRCSKAKIQHLFWDSRQSLNK